MKKMLKRLCTGFLALATVVTALPTTPVHAESKQYWTESAERVGIIEKVMNDGSISSTFNEGMMKVEGETAYCIDINTDFKNGYKTRADASSRMSTDQISDVALYFITLALFVIVSLAISCVLGLAVKNQAKLTMYSQVVFLPSIMLSGIMFSAELLPNFLESIGKLFPATWGYTLLIQKNIDISTFLPLLLILAISVFASMQLLKKIRSE